MDASEGYEAPDALAAAPSHEWCRMVRAADAHAREVAADPTTGPAILATVVDVAGSAYRRPGARMLILPGGDRVGAISGGCLEDDLCRSARAMTEDGPRVVSFDTRDETAGVKPRYNLGCRGVIHVLLQRLTGDAACPLAPIRAVLAGDTPEVVARVYQANVEPSGAARSSAARCSAAVGERLDPATAFDGALAEPAARIADEGGSVCVQLASEARSCHVLIERVDPPRPLWIFGSGHDAEPLAALATSMGWRVTVIDRRPGRLRAASLPSSTARLVVDWADARDRLQPTALTAAVLMTHDLGDDTALLPWLLGSDAGYIGLLGPKARTARAMRDLHAGGSLPSGDQLARLHTPVGLDLGASNPAEIALAIISEIVAEAHGRPGGKLGERDGPIHAPATHVLVEIGRTDATEDASSADAAVSASVSE